jgi:MYXO-CTERM domain-containing protein
MIVQPRWLRIAGGCVVTAVLTATSALTLATPATAAASHVAIVIGGQQSTCVPWHSGMTGDQLLNEVASVHYGSSGIIDQIGGLPTDRSIKPNYWAYWHNTGAGWSYSGVGASGYQVPAGSVEGWVYNNGSGTPSGSYAGICAGADAPAPPPAGPHSSSPPRPTSAASPSSGQSPTGAGVNSATGAGATSDGSGPANEPTVPGSKPSSAPTRSPAHAAAGTSAAAAVSAESPAGSSSSTPATSRTIQAGPVADATSTGTATGLLVALLATAALGGAAFWRRRRLRSE